MTELRARIHAYPVAREVQVRVLTLLSEADFVKFAKVRPPIDQASDAERRARDIVRDTMPRAQPETVA